MSPLRVCSNKPYPFLTNLSAFESPRHWRATQLADDMDPFTLKKALHRATRPFEYVHRAESRRLEREEEADRIWA